VIGSKQITVKYVIKITSIWC